MAKKNISLPYITKKEYILGLLTTPFSTSSFFLTLLINDVVSKFCGLFSKKCVYWLFRLECRIALLTLKMFAGSKFYINKEKIKNLPTDRPIIVVSNHQSLYETAIHTITLKKNKIIFIAKKELGEKIPLVSYALRSQGAALIDRDNPKQSVKEIIKMGKRIENEKIAVCIYAEGTRAKDGMLKEFKESGIKTLLKYAPDALIVPVAVDGSWKTFAYSYFPIPFGVKFFVEYMTPIEAKDCNIETITQELHDMVNDKINEFRGINKI